MKEGKKRKEKENERRNKIWNWKRMKEEIGQNMKEGK